MATALTEFYTPVRVVLGDLDCPYNYTDTALRDGLRATIQSGRVPGYKLTPDRLSITPDPTEPADYARVMLHTALLFARSRPDHYEHRQRAFQERFGSFRDLVCGLEGQLYEIDNGGMVSGWQQFNTWSLGMFGVALGPAMTGLEVSPPWSTVNLDSGGATASSSTGEDMRQNVLYTSVGALADGAFLLGAHVCPVKQVARSVVFHAAPPAGTVSLQAVINGVADAELAFAVGSGVSSLTLGFSRLLDQNDEVRWQCVTAPADPNQSASEVSVNLMLDNR